MGFLQGPDVSNTPLNGYGLWIAYATVYQNSLNFAATLPSPKLSEIESDVTYTGTRVRFFNGVTVIGMGDYVSISNVPVLQQYSKFWMQTVKSQFPSILRRALWQFIATPIVPEVYIRLLPHREYQ
ncbi:hypothetical protein CBL_11164 [Carabus blaptoides fortunei]